MLSLHVWLEVMIIISTLSSCLNHTKNPNLLLIKYYNKSLQMAEMIPLLHFESLITKLTESSTKALLLVTSDKNQDGSYWCPDCEAIKPLYPIFEQESKKAGLPYYIIVAGDRPTWKNPENPLRKHKALLIKSVPTLGLFDGKKIVKRLVENEILDHEQRGLLYE